MSNLQGWNYLEEGLHRYFLEEYMKHKETNHLCDFCDNAIDYICTVYIGNDQEILARHQLCAKHDDNIKKKYYGIDKLKFKHRPFEI